ncbi:2-methylcitrate dehydratase PrpD [Variovorax boronicumulans]|uniref:2-methylcitrate dehydratase PrpD n=1 Tax=Variovorax boronicumulans TaxID=436515 RepID=A0AAW8DU85_9BURK|nr:2-methylcitrate dehydratase PrpD [Variovorax boronicumulans]MDP9923014.1 2-methylcitrate dehydratase PrpD [Variovorax boronicumulans]
MHRGPGRCQPALGIACYDRSATANEARFSLHYVVATALTHGSVRLAAYEPAQLDDVRTRELMTRIDVRVDPAIDAAFPGRRAARVEITTHDGVKLVHLQPDRSGDPELPLSDAELDSKFLELRDR